MAVINFNDIFGKDFSKIKDLEKLLNEIAATQKKLQDQAVANNETLKETNTTRAQTAKITKNVAENLDLLAKSEKEVEKITKKTSETLAKARAERTKEGQQLAKATILRQEQNKKIKEAIKLEQQKKKGIVELTQAEINYNKAVKAVTDATAKADALRTKEGNQLLKINEQKKENTKTTKLQITANNALNGSYKQINAALLLNVDKYKKLSKEQRDSTKAGKALAKTIQRQDAELKKLDARMGRSQRNVGNYGSAIKGLGGSVKSLAASFGLLGGIALFAKVLKGAINTSVKFAKQMDAVKAKTNATDAEMVLLSNSAKLLGSTTTKTAIEVGRLQEEFAKLGFSTTEILAATEATISLAEATGSDLALSATVAASTVRGMGLAASDTQRVVDVMAASFSATGLDIDRFKVSMANAQVAAKSTNRTYEETVAMLGTIIDTGTDASKAGTDLRSIFGKLAKKGIDLKDAYEKINTSSDKVVTAMSLVGDRAFSSLITLAENREKVDELTHSYENSAGAAKKMADIMKDNLAGDVAALQSAWEGMILSIEDGTGFFTKSMRAIAKRVTLLLNVIKELNTSLEDLESEKMNEFLVSFREELDLLTDAELKNKKQLLESGAARAKAAKEDIKIIKLLASQLSAVNDQIKSNRSDEERIANEKLKAEQELIAKQKKAQEIAAEDAAKKAKKLAKKQEVDRAQSLINLMNLEDKYYASLATANEAEIESIQRRYEKELEFAEASGVDKARIAEIEALMTKEINDTFIEQAKKRKEEEAKLSEERISKINTDAQQEIATQQKKLELKKINEDQYSTFLIEIETNRYNNLLLEQQKELDSIDINDEKKKEQRAELLKKMEELQLEHETNMNEIEEDTEKKRKERNQKRLEATIFILEQSSELINAFTDFRLSKIENELISLEKQRDSEVSLAKERGEDTEEIEKKFADKRRVLEEKQFKAKKKADITKAILNTAVGVTSALTIPPPVGPILAAVVGVLGGIQISKIASTPMPKFKEGGEMKKSGLAKFSEEGRELKIMPSGKISLTPDKETIGFVPKGTKFIPHWETEKIIQGGATEERVREATKQQKQPTVRRYEINGANINETIETANGRVKLDDVYYRR